MSQLSEQKCVPCEGGIPALDRSTAQAMLKELGSGWELNDTAQEISKDFKFKGFYKTMAFVNALAWIANQEAHHPDFEVGYNHCLVRFTTHAVDGLTKNDFICAAKVEDLNPL